jgi:hypothetical protein
MNKEEEVMKKLWICLAVVGCMLLMGGRVFAAQKGPVETFAEGCQKEITTYCKDVIPGNGRVLACLYAREDKLSVRCEYAIYDAAAQLERAVAALAYLANECRDDLKTYCSGVKAGEGRLLQCIDNNRAKVSSRCKQAMKDVKLKKE